MVVNRWDRYRDLPHASRYVDWRLRGFHPGADENCSRRRGVHFCLAERRRRRVGRADILRYTFAARDNARGLGAGAKRRELRLLPSFRCQSTSA